MPFFQDDDLAGLTQPDNGTGHRRKNNSRFEFESFKDVVGRKSPGRVFYLLPNESDIPTVCTKLNGLGRYYHSATLFIGERRFRDRSITYSALRLSP